ncbi:MAG TPA: TerC/Alx family metal homeostasis membrane protein [Polyangiaceae bacterium]
MPISSAGTTETWIAFAVMVGLFLALDLGIFQRGERRTMPGGVALAWTAGWVALALLFAVGIGVRVGSTAALQFVTGYLVELSLSVDNLFVFVVIFESFGVPARRQHRVLFWGILGALLTRGAFIGAGIALFQRFHWLNYPFGALLVYAGIRVLLRKRSAPTPKRGILFRGFQRLIPAVDHYEGAEFTTRSNGRRYATPLLLALVAIEMSDIAFAMDSIPAVFAVSRDAFIVYTSNIFAILGLRSMYFALTHVLGKLKHVNIALSLILSFVGFKLIVNSFYEISLTVSLLVIAGVLGFTFLISFAGELTRRLQRFVSVDAQGVESPSPPSANIQVDSSMMGRLRRVGVTLVGFAVLAAGIAMIVLPGPAVVVIPLGLGILASEYRWARTLLLRFRAQALRIVRRRSNARQSPH